VHAGKHFTQEKHCEKIVFGYDDVMHRDDDHLGTQREELVKTEKYSRKGLWLERKGVLIIVEGEMDKMACNEVCPRQLPLSSCSCRLLLVTHPCSQVSLAWLFGQ
jgi:hypothetical protein